jgi:hypothetical protein
MPISSPDRKQTSQERIASRQQARNYTDYPSQTEGVDVPPQASMEAVSDRSNDLEGQEVGL